jgi:U3 small nucleolar RNA-associated protein 6
MENAIHRRLESMVPAFEQWAKYEIFSKEEIQKIVKKRKQFEFALSGANSSREGYLEAIDYEMKLNALLQIRWKDVKHKIKCSLKDKSEGITAAEEKKKLPTMPKQHLFSVVARIHSLFERYLKFHSNDFAFWDQYFEFCMKSGSVHKLGSALAK